MMLEFILIQQPAHAGTLVWTIKWNKTTVNAIITPVLSLLWKVKYLPE